MHKILSLFFLILYLPFTLNGEISKEQHAVLLELLDLMNITHDNTLSSIVQETQKNG